MKSPISSPANSPAKQSLHQPVPHCRGEVIPPRKQTAIPQQKKCPHPRAFFCFFNSARFQGMSSQPSYMISHGNTPIRITQVQGLSRKFGISEFSHGGISTKLTILIYQLNVVVYRGLRFLKQLRHLVLRQPNHILLKSNVNPSHTIRCGVHQQKRILFIVSHELKTHPLTGITSASLSQPPLAVKQRNIKSCIHTRTLHLETSPNFVPIPCHAIVRKGGGGTLPYSLITIHSTMFLGVLKIDIANQLDLTSHQISSRYKITQHVTFTLLFGMHLAYNTQVPSCLNHLTKITLLSPCSLIR